MRIGAGEKGGAENRCQQVLQPVKAVAGEVVPQPLYGEIGIDNAHKGADEEEQQQDFDAIIHKKVYCAAQGRSTAEHHKGIDEPVCKLLYHSCSNFGYLDKNQIKPLVMCGDYILE